MPARQSRRAVANSSLREKFLVRGAEELSDGELLSLLLDGVSSGDFAVDALLEHYDGSLSQISREDQSRLRMVAGLGQQGAVKLLVAFELGRRCVLEQSGEVEVVKNSSDVVALFRPLISSLNHEECWVLYLNASNRVLERQTISKGGIVATLVDHRLVVKRALELLATQIILVHNHPSGSVEPSDEDIELTKKIKSAAALFDIDLLDHIIISRDQDFSLLASGLL